MDEDIAMKFWREWDESVDKEKHIKVIVDSVMCAADHIKEAKSKERKKAMLSFLAMSLNGYFTDLYCFAHTKGFEEAQSQGRKGLDDNRFI